MKRAGEIVGVLIGLSLLIVWWLLPAGKGIWDLVTRPSEVLPGLFAYWMSEVRGIAFLIALGFVVWLLSKAWDRWRARKR